MSDKKHYILGLLPLFDLLKSSPPVLEEILKKYGIDPNTMTGDTTIYQKYELKIIEEALEHIGEPLPGLKIGSQLNMEYYGVYLLMVMSAPNVLEAISISARFQGLSFMFSQLSIHHFDDYIEGRLIPPKVDSHIKNVIIDRDLAGSNRFLEVISPRLQQHVKYGLERPRPEDSILSRYHSVFKDSVCFDQDYSWFRLTTSVAAQKMPSSNTLAHNLYKSQCQILLNKLYPLSEDIASQIRYQLNSYEGVFPQISDIAKMFSLTERTLRRKLKDCHTGYSEIVDQVRKERAIECLVEHRYPVKKTADLLGYSSPVSFLAAFKRWTSMTPRSYLQQSDDRE